MLRYNVVDRFWNLERVLPFLSPWEYCCTRPPQPQLLCCPVRLPLSSRPAPSLLSSAAEHETRSRFLRPWVITLRNRASLHQHCQESKVQAGEEAHNLEIDTISPQCRSHEHHVFSAQVIASGRDEYTYTGIVATPVFCWQGCAGHQQVHVKESPVETCSALLFCLHNFVCVCIQTQTIT